MKELVNDFGKYTSIISLVFLIGAIFNQWYYYKDFGIDILALSSLSEIFSIFISSLPVSIILSLVALFSLIGFKILFNKYFRKYFDTLKVNSLSRVKYRKRGATITVIFTLVWMVGYAYYIIVKYDRSMVYGGFITKLVVTFLLLFYILCIINCSLSNWNQRGLRPIKYILSLITVFVLVIYFSMNYKEILLKYYPDQIKHVSILLKDGRYLVTDDNLLYLGENLNYVFIYNRGHLPGFSEIIRRDEIKEFKIFDNRTFGFFLLRAF